MWINPLFQLESREAVSAMIGANPLATLVVAAPLRGSHMPVLLERLDEDGCVLIGHMPKADPASAALGEGERMLAIFHGAKSYVSSGWYTTPGLPTYNYSVVHIEGVTEIIQDPAELREHLIELIALQEAHKHVPGDHPWQPGQEAHQRIDVLLPLIVGFRLIADTVQAKAKLGQNRPEPDRAAAAAVLGRSTLQEERQVAAEMRAALGHAAKTGEATT